MFNILKTLSTVTLQFIYINWLAPHPRDRTVGKLIICNGLDLEFDSHGSEYPRINDGPLAV